MARKIDSHRIYLIIRGIVVAVSALALLLGIYSALVYQSRETEYLAKFDKCQREAELDGLGGFDSVCWRYFDLIDNTQNTAIYGIAIGLGLPILFFGGKAFIGYIAPEVKPEKETA